MTKHFEVGAFPYHATEKRLPDEVYARALDRMVISTLDVAVINPAGELLLGKRAWEPAKGLYWIIGGARNRGESFEETATRLTKYELDIEVGKERFKEIGSYSYAFAKRRQEPADHGVHTDGTVFSVALTADEVAALKPNEEYEEMKWVRPDDVVKGADYHPAIVQVCKDYLHRCSAGNSAL